jgi:hypothetical protein
MKTTTKRGVAAAGALALVVGIGGVLVSAPAQADTTVTEGELDWGFRQSFRTYVGGQLGAGPGAVPVGQRIVVTAPATFDAAAAGTAETRPYTFPATGTSVTSTTDLSVQTDGTVTYNFPAHFFTITISDPAIQVSGATKSLVADVEVVIPENTGGFTPGTFGGQDVVLGDVANVSTVIAGDAKSATITGTGVTLSAAGSAALQSFLAEGDALDDFSATVSLEDPQVVVPTVTVDKTVVNPAGDTVTVTGTGFDPTLAIGTRPPLSGQQSGTYAVFGTFLDVWKPSLGTTVAPSTARKVSTQRWAVPADKLATIDPTSSGVGIVLSPEGSFTATLAVQRGFTGALANGNYGIYTYGGSGAVAPSFETYTPITFEAATADAPTTGAIVQPGDTVDVEGTGFNAGETVNVVLHSTPTTLGTLTANGSGEVSGSVTIPTDTELGAHSLFLAGVTSGVEVLAASFSVGNPDLTAYQTITTEVVPTGALTISVDDNTVVLPSPELSSDGMALETSGALNAVTVTDLRIADPGWSVTGTITDFAGTAGTFDGNGLTWTPSVISTGNGQAVTAGDASNGLEAGKLLGSGAADAGRGTAQLGGALDLTLPTTVDPGTYVATLTLTAI